MHHYHGTPLSGTPKSQWFTPNKTSNSISENMMGVRFKYQRFIDILEDDNIYTPASIFYNGVEVEEGVIRKHLGPYKFKTISYRVRCALMHFRKRHKFPEEGDGTLTMPGQRPVPGWLGWRWKQAAKNQRER